MASTLKMSRELIRSKIKEPGQLLEYRAKEWKMREQHNLAVPRGLLQDVMAMIYPEDLERRGPEETEKGNNR